MNELEAIDLMLKHDYEYNNKEYRGFVSPDSLFNELYIPNDMRSYLLDGVLELGLFEYNTPKTGIRASYKGRTLYRDGGYIKYKKNEKIADWIGYLERFINTIKP